MASFDLVVRNGTIHDGTGKAGFVADVGIVDGRIVEVGSRLGAGRQEIDAGDQLVTPGFVDIHTHYDGQASWAQRLSPSGWHGVTTAVMGNCGVGFAPVRATDHSLLVQLMEGVEDIPGVVLEEGLDWQWESFDQYLAALGRQSHDIDFCAQLPHAALRIYVMGERAARLEEATEADAHAMRTLARDAMAAGAVGFSTSRTLIHKTSKGEPLPTLRATEHELEQIALGMTDAGGGVLEFRTDFDTAERCQSEMDMIRRVVQASGRPATVSLFQQTVIPDGWRPLFELVEAAHRDGLPVRAQVAPRQLGMLLSLQGTENPFSNTVAYRAIARKPLAEKVAIMREPEFRRTVLGEDRNMNRPFDYMFRMGRDFDYAAPYEQSLPAIARREGRGAAEVAYDLLLEDEGRNFIYYAAANYDGFNFDVCRKMLASPATVLGLGDAGAHVTSIVDASFPTFFLSYWARDRAAGRFELPWAIRRLTQDGAQAVGLTDRGVIAPGMKADLNVIDFDALRCERPYMAFDLPAGGHRLLQGARGYTATIVSGKPVYRNGEATDQLPGKLVRGPAYRARAAA